MGLLRVRYLLGGMVSKKINYLVRLVRFIKWNFLKVINRILIENIIEMNIF